MNGMNLINEIRKAF